MTRKKKPTTSKYAHEIHFAKRPDATETVAPGEAICGAGEQSVTALFNDVTCPDCVRIVRDVNHEEDAADDFTLELARRLASAYLSLYMDTNFETVRKRYAGQPGSYWLELADRVKREVPAAVADDLVAARTRLTTT
jgi:hypothetical protein